MKKLLTSLSLLFSLSLICQPPPPPNWDSVVFNGFGGASHRVYDLSSFQGKLYAASDTLIGGAPDAPRLFKSLDGINWVPEGAFPPVTQGGTELNVSALANDGTYLFIGTANTNGGPQYYPQVYRFDGVNYQMYDTIPYPGGGGNYKEIANLLFFNQSGGSDTIYAFVSAILGMEIWRADATIANPTWTMVHSMTTSNAYVRDVIVFNGKIYALITDTGVGGVILKSSDGATWTTIASGTQIGTTANPNNTELTSLEMLNGKLYVAAKNGTNGAQLYATTNPDPAANGDFFLTNFSSDLAVNSSMDEITDMAVKQGKLFIAYRQSGANNHPEVAVSDLLGASFFTVSAGTPLINSASPALTRYRLNPFGDQMYLTSNSTANEGEIWRIYVPMADFNLPAPACPNQPVTFTNATTGPAQIKWYVNGTLIGTPFHLNYAFTAPGSYAISLVASHTNLLSDSLTYSFNVLNPPPSPVIAFSPNDSLCAGQTVTLAFTPTGGTPPFTHFAATATGPVSGAGTLFWTPTATENDSAWVVDNSGCPSPPVPFTLYVSSGNQDILGSASYSGGPVASATTYLIRSGMQSSLFDTVATTTTSPGGTFSFVAMPPDNYYVKVISPSLPDVYDTYLGDHYLWDSAMFFSHNCFNASNLPVITMVETPAVTGPVTLAGVIREGAGFGMKVIPGPVPFANVIPGVPVKVGKNPGGQIVGGSVSDSTGAWSVSNLPYDTYFIFTDLPGYPMDSSYVIVASAGNDSITGLDYFVDSNSVYIDITSSQPFTSLKNNSGFLVYPNPSEGKIWLKSNGDATNISAMILDATGRIIYDRKYSFLAKENAAELDAGNLQAGLYTLIIQSGNQRKTVKLIVTR